MASIKWILIHRGSALLSVAAIPVCLMFPASMPGERVVHKSDVLIQKPRIVRDEQGPEAVAARRQALERITLIQRGRTFMARCCSGERIYQDPSGMTYANPEARFKAPKTSGRCTVSVDNSPFFPCPQGVQFGAEGRHSLLYRMENGAQKEEAGLSVTVDATPPKIHMLLRGNAFVNGSTVFLSPGASLSFQAVDNVAGVESILIDRSGDGFIPYKGELMESAPRPFVVRVFAADRVGNASSEVRSVVQDGAGPGIAFSVHPPLKEGYCAPGSILAIDAHDGGAGTSSVKFQVNESAFAPYTVPLTLSGEGAVEVHSVASDRLGNTSAGSFSCTIDSAKNPVRVAP